MDSTFYIILSFISIILFFISMIVTYLKRRDLLFEWFLTLGTISCTVAFWGLYRGFSDLEEAVLFHSFLMGNLIYQPIFLLVVFGDNEKSDESKAVE